MSSLECAISATMEHRVELVEKNVLSLAQNVSELRKDIVAANVLQVYLTKEVGFKNELKRKLEDITNNFTKLSIRLDELETNNTALQIVTAEQNLSLQELTRNNTALLRNMTEQNICFEELATFYTALHVNTAEQNLRLDELNSNYTVLMRNMAEQNLHLEELNSNYTVLIRNMAEQNHHIEELTSNYTALQTLYTESATERRNLHEQLKELANNQSALQNQYYTKVKEQERNHTILQGLVKGVQQNISAIGVLYKDDLQQTYTLNQKHSTLEKEVRLLSLSLTDVEKKQQDSNDTLWNSAEQVKQTLASLQRDLLLNISSLHTDLNQYKSSRKF